MACGTTIFRTIFLTEPWRPLPHKPIAFFHIHKPNLRSCGCKLITSQNYNLRQKNHYLNCSKDKTQSPSEDENQGPPQEVVLKAISEVSRTEGRVGQTTNVIIGGTVHDENAANEWLALDKKVNSYPTERGFTAIGTGGDDFVQAMVVAVESVIQQPIPEGQVKQKLSSGGKYVSVNIGPIQVVSSEQVQAVYNAMRRDDRMKYFL